MSADHIAGVAPDLEEGWTLIHVATKMGKNSSRITHYTIQTVPEDEVPTPTVRMKVQSKWTRRDREASPEQPEIWDIPSYKLSHLISEHGTKHSQSKG